MVGTDSQTDKPGSDLPEELVRAIEAFLLHRDQDEASRRVELLFLAHQAVFLDDESSDPWIKRVEEIERAGSNSFGDSQTLAPLMRMYLSPETDPDLVASRWDSISDLIGECGDLVVDREKLIGHLLIVHNGSIDLLDLADPELVAHHAVFHDGSRDVT